MSDRLQEIKQRAEAATPGLWVVNNSNHVEYPTKDSAKMCQILEPWDQYYTPGWYFDAEFIAHAREDIPWLIERVEMLAEEVDRLRSALIDAGIEIESGYSALALDRIDNALKGEK